MITYTITAAATVTLAAVVKYIYKYGIVWGEEALAGHHCSLEGRVGISGVVF